MSEANEIGKDGVVPFFVEDLDVRGRAVQLGSTIDKILSRHDYPEPIAELLAQVIIFTVLLGTSLKFEGKFTVQTQGDGPVELLVADFTSPDNIRAYAKFNEERYLQAKQDGKLSPPELLGKGVLGLTVDQGKYMQRYQGIVAMDGSSLEEMAGTYFRQSEQIPTIVKLGVAQLVDSEGDGELRHHWRAGGLIAQYLPTASNQPAYQDFHGGDGDENSKDANELLSDHWLEARALVSTVKLDELVDPQVDSKRLLYRLFHEQNVRVFDELEIVDKCSCSREKILSVLQNFTAEEIEQSAENGEIIVKCEFCSTSHNFLPADIL